MPDVRTDIASLLLDRVGDQHLGLRTRDRDWTWDEVVAESAARGALAEAMRVDGPLHVGVLLDNVPDFLFWLGGAALVGATIVGINPTRGAAELAAEIRLADCQLIVTDTAGAQRLRDLDLGLTRERFLVVDGPDYAAQVDAHRVAPTASPKVTEDSLMLLLFTSGTTGASKAVICSQGRLARIAYAAAEKFGHVREDVEYCCMPLFHGNAIMALWAPALSVGATVCLTPSFSASGFLPDVRYFGATFFTYVGKALGYLMATPERPDDADNPLVRGFGTEASPDDQNEFRRRFDAELFEGYGSSEGGGAVVLAPDMPPGALGRPAHDGVAIIDPESLKDCVPAVFDQHGRVLNPDDAVGEIVDKFGTRTFEGYYKNDEANAERIRNGWYWTGDLGYLDEQGFIYFAGRRGDWIRVDGENTSALNIERVLRRHPEVVAAGAYAVPDPRSGDQVMAAIEVADPDGFDAAAFVSYLSSQEDLGAKAIPRFLRVSKNLPVTGSNKVLKRQLQKERWRTDEVVYRWAGRGEPVYRAMGDDDKKSLDDEFAKYGRQRYL
ncbi:AMP-binding protein [Mycolicibacterium fortuitum]|uniref:Acyl-CoA synthetase n=1 Tax=Mycolicibacterium fortuitum subsp. fortuitum DSM 46621 = ATCC 6841 = JCM 6387 TaxID=1214102 RepID=K0V6M5_MYCFO|nr:AMP-binding protein [Mycolicibacterium fortuitum]AIY45713.1 acyl-CoA synthase [Mycobacterium sp. VKM Ac-1817D]CRL80022.1 acyl-CoA synthetase [Mycolicibacter nonchromogenicus]EJZ14837.1 acyl-CoA synthetase [Mycolicibacterium fortuitum subsp. fortuitum DSM 46621 = ATCC 6841 = JCM 6387]WEV34552.1 AMP-binding protein [Mycolicibacterium fortuitum]BDD97788.1 putative fatty-acid-CoA ligase FadD [Mycolicibacterium fortuitum subsp. fortuitum]